MDQYKEHTVNTVDYWDTRFGSGDWATKGGFSQTRLFAAAQLPLFRIPSDFKGIICDFGCGAGDAFPLYRQAWPQARLLGIDFSVEAIKLCTERYGSIAEFTSGDASQVPNVDFIICSNVLEHVDDDTSVIDILITRSRVLYIIVPYDEQPLSEEHIRKYSDGSFSTYPVVRKAIFKSPGWTEFGIKSLAGIHLGNIAHSFTGQPKRRRRLQILFEISSDSGRGL